MLVAYIGLLLYFRSKGATSLWCSTSSSDTLGRKFHDGAWRNATRLEAHKLLMVLIGEIVNCNVALNSEYHIALTSMHR
jgi:hypothetical protein